MRPSCGWPAGQLSDLSSRQQGGAGERRTLDSHSLTATRNSVGTNYHPTSLANQRNLNSRPGSREGQSRAGEFRATGRRSPALFVRGSASELGFLYLRASALKSNVFDT